MTSFWDLAIVVAGPFGGLVAGVAGYPAAFALAAAPAVLAAVLAFGILRQRDANFRAIARNGSGVADGRRSQSTSAHGRAEGGRPAGIFLPKIDTYIANVRQKGYRAATGLRRSGPTREEGT